MCHLVIISPSPSESMDVNARGMEVMRLPETRGQKIVHTDRGLSTYSSIVCGIVGESG